MKKYIDHLNANFPNRNAYHSNESHLDAIDIHQSLLNLLIHRKMAKSFWVVERRDENHKWAPVEGRRTRLGGRALLFSLKIFNLKNSNNYRLEKYIPSL